MRWGDMDAYGHVNNVAVLRLLEEARVLAFGPPGGTGAPGAEPVAPLFSEVPDGVQALVAEHRVKYTAPLEYRNVPAQVEVWVTDLKPASLTIGYVLRDPVRATPCVRAETTLAFVDGASGRLHRISARQRELIAPYVGPPALS